MKNPVKRSLVGPLRRFALNGTFHKSQKKTFERAFRKSMKCLS